MQNTLTPSLIRALSTPDPAALAGRLRLGQVLTVTAVRAASAGETSIIRLAGQLVEARSALALEVGQRLKVEVARTAPQLELRVIRDASTPRTLPTPRAAVLREALPYQGSVARALDSLNAMAPRLAAARPADATAHANLTGALRALERAGATPEQLANADTLRSLVKRSGTFLEATLASLPRGTIDPGLASDLKAQLLVLRHALQGMRAGDERLARAASPARATSSPSAAASTPSAATAMADAGAAGAPRTITSTGSGPELRAAPAEDPAAPVRDASYKAASHGQTRVGVGEAAARSHGLTTADADEALRSVRQAVESGLARIEVNQALSARAGGDTQPALLVDIPLRSDAETRRDVRLVMQRERHHGATDGEHVWRVEIALEPPDLGPIRARVTLGGETVSATVSAERDETRALLDSALPQLSQALTLQGLAVGELRAVRALARDDVPSSIGASASLLSLKA